MSDKRKLNTLRKDLYGHYKKIAKKADVSKQWVSLVLRDKVQDANVLAVAIAVHKEVMREKANKLILKQQLLNQIRK